MLLLKIKSTVIKFITGKIVLDYLVLWILLTALFITKTKHTQVFKSELLVVTAYGLNDEGMLGP